MLDTTFRSLERATRPHREPMRRIFASLEPLEAIALLGFIAAETLERFNPHQRTTILAALCNELHTPHDA